jgi:hypothetical protein
LIKDKKRYITGIHGVVKYKWKKNLDILEDNLDKL